MVPHVEFTSIEDVPITAMIPVNLLPGMEMVRPYRLWNDRRGLGADALPPSRLHLAMYRTIYEERDVPIYRSGWRLFFARLFRTPPRTRRALVIVGQEWRREGAPLELFSVRVGDGEFVPVSEAVVPELRPGAALDIDVRIAVPLDAEPIIENVRLELTWGETMGVN